MSNVNRVRVMRQSVSEAKVRVAELSSATRQQQDWQSAFSALIVTAAVLVYFAIN